MANLHGIVIKGTPHYFFSLSEIEQKIESIKTLKAKSEQETQKLKFDAIQKLPDFIYDQDIDCNYKKVFDRQKLEVYYEAV